MTTITGTPDNDTLSVAGHEQVDAGDGNDTITIVPAAEEAQWQHSTGALYYDADGNGAAAQVQFAQLGAGGVTLTASDIQMS